MANNVNPKKMPNNKIKNKIERKKKEDGINRYYQKVADRIKRLKGLACLSLLFLVIGGLVFMPEDVTLANIISLGRYMDIVPAARAATHEFRIDADEHASYAYHRNNVVVLRRNRLDIYDINGRRNASFNIAYSNPVLQVSDRYILAYDLGRNQLDVFNLVSRVFEYTGERPIFGARVTDRGYIVYITNERGYTSVVRVLNRSFAEMFGVYRVRDYVMDADICDGARHLVIAGFYAEGGDFLTSILLYRTDSEEPVGDIQVRGEKPLRVNMNDAGFCVVLESSIRFYDLSGTETGRYNFAGSAVQMAELGRDFSAVVLRERIVGNENRIVIFDSNTGNKLFEDYIDTEIMDIKLAGSYIYLLTRRGIYRLSPAEDIIERFIPRTNEHGEAMYDETARRIILANDRNIILAGLSSVNILELD